MSEITRKSEIILYQTEDGKTRLEVRLEQESIWLTQAVMAELFQFQFRAIQGTHYLIH